jgi:hypothetical protein
MNSLGLAFLLVNAIALLLLPRRWAPLPFLIGACYVTRDQMIQVGLFHFNSIRLLIVAGLLRVLIRRERLDGRMNGLDQLMLGWTFWILVSSFFHKDPSAAIIFRLGLAYDVCGIYFLLRIFFRSLDDVKDLCRLTAILLLPVAAEMIYEKVTDHNLFSALFGGSEIPNIREGSIRARGPFAHAILAGTVGAVCLPLMVGIWQQQRKTAIVGIIACLTMIITCASSGPIMSATAAIGALFLWRYHNQPHRLRFIRWFAIMIYIALDIIMKDPAYYIMARIDFVGGSTGWHRARLIQTAINHLPEWWLAGTDYTRHWMASGVTWSPDHIDITNHYLQQGVVGGLPLMLLFILILAKGFSFVGQTLRHETDPSQETHFILWSLGACLFTHAVTFIAVSYFDQSFLFIYLCLAAIGSAWSSKLSLRPVAIVNTGKKNEDYLKTTLKVSG